MYNGIINVYKEPGFTSHDVVAKLRGIAKQKKIGHTGTLDPEAVGVLPVCLGNATKLCDLLLDKSKEYIAQMRLGVTTDTQDMTGTVLSQCPVTVSEEDVRSVASSFVGLYMQIPPMYSALKVNGQKLYDLARQGIEIEREARPVTVYELEILSIDLPVVTMRVSCSKGTYIRSLCHDIGNKLGCGGAMEQLTRSKVGAFEKEDALTLSALQLLADENRLAEVVLPVDCMFTGLPAYQVTPEGMAFLRNGNPLPENVVNKMTQEPAKLVSAAEMITVPEKSARIYGVDYRFYGVYTKKGALLKPYKMFFPDQQS